MRRLGVIFGMLALVVIVLGAQPASAGPEPFNQQLEVRGIVLPYHTLVVNENGVVVRILSNTEGDDAVLRVFLDNVSTENRLPLTKEVYSQYRQLVPEGKSRIGVLYEYGASRPMWTPLDSETPPHNTWSPLGLSVTSSSLAVLWPSIRHSA